MEIKGEDGGPCDAAPAEKGNEESPPEVNNSGPPETVVDLTKDRPLQRSEQFQFHYMI